MKQPTLDHNHTDLVYQLYLYALLVWYVICHLIVDSEFFIVKCDAIIL
jgi:hypothetical protein